MATIKNLKKLGVNHIAIIMDGNGRWAKKRFLPRSMGHKSGLKVFEDILEYCNNIQLKIFTVYAFSTENWKRPKPEVDYIMSLLEDYFARVLNDEKFNIDKRVKVKIIGSYDGLSDNIIKNIQLVEEKTKNNDGITLNLCLNYGGRLEITECVKKIARMVRDNSLNINSIDEQLISNNLYTAYQDDPDIVIRPGGECRTSNFLIWQSAYSELIFLDTLWPDFKPRDIDNAVDEFCKRNRRFGGI